MSDQAQGTTLADATGANPALAGAQQALAIKELGETVAAMKQKIRTLWIAFAVLAVVTVIVGAFALGPRFGLNLGMGGGRSGAFFQNGQTPGGNGNFQRNPGNDQPVPAP